MSAAWAWPQECRGRGRPLQIQLFLGRAGRTHAGQEEAKGATGPLRGARAAAHTHWLAPFAGQRAAGRGSRARRGPRHGPGPAACCARWRGRCRQSPAASPPAGAAPRTQGGMQRAFQSLQSFTAGNPAWRQRPPQRPAMQPCCLDTHRSGSRLGGGWRRAHVQASLKLIHRRVDRLRHRRQRGIQPGSRVALGQQPAAALLPVNCGRARREASGEGAHGRVHSCEAAAVVSCARPHRSYGFSE